MVVSLSTDGKLGFEVIKAIEMVRSIECFVVFTVTALHFAIVACGIRADDLMADATLF